MTPKHSRGSKFGPVSGFAQPLQVVSEEGVVGGFSVHQASREGDGGVENRVSGFQTVFDLVQYRQINPVRFVEEFNVQVY